MRLLWHLCATLAIKGMGIGAKEPFADFVARLEARGVGESLVLLKVQLYDLKKRRVLAVSSCLRKTRPKSLEARHNAPRLMVA